MSEKIGKIIFVDFNEQSAVAIEEGGDKTVYEIPLEGVGDELGKLGYSLEGTVIRFTVNKNNTVTSATALAFRSAECENCGGGGLGMSITQAAKECDCGRITNDSFECCEVCAIQKGKCAYCGTAF